ncbi:MAG: sulfotransferase family protein [Acidimicrobiales bacterium]
MREPIIVLGAPRSGTSFLADVLGAHPDVAVAREPRLVWRFGNDRRSDELRVEHARPDVVDHIHRSFALVLEQSDAARLVEKTPANSLRPRFVDAVFPDARFVHITRSGWGAVPSIRSFWARRATGFDTRQVRKLRRRLREARPSQVPYYASELIGRVRGAGGRHTPLYGPRLAGLQVVADELGVLTAAAVQWRACVEQAAVFGRSLPSERYVELRLETLDRHAIESVVDFCGLPTGAEVSRRFVQLYSLDEAVHQATLTDEERTVVAPYVDPVNAWLGYADRAVPELSDHKGAP